MKLFRHKYKPKLMVHHTETPRMWYPKPKDESDINGMLVYTFTYAVWRKYVIKSKSLIHENICNKRTGPGS
jgi:hypothetical protein